ncbi:MAG TPA: hypothetical protein ENF42_00815 [Candidatus Bathyarchaeota archaeon]|nr:hypothetical protein [Candidatus Bathyarchaeota archaeon]
MMYLHLDTSALKVALTKDVLETLARKGVEIHLTHIQVDEHLKKLLPLKEYCELVEYIKRKFEEKGIKFKLTHAKPFILGISRLRLAGPSDKKTGELYARVLRKLLMKHKDELVPHKMAKDEFEELLREAPRVELSKLGEKSRKIIAGIVRDACILTSFLYDTRRQQKNYVFLTGDSKLYEVAMSEIEENRLQVRAKLIKPHDPRSLLEKIDC